MPLSDNFSKLAILSSHMAFAPKKCPINIQIAPGAAPVEIMNWGFSLNIIFTNSKKEQTALVYSIERHL